MVRATAPRQPVHFTLDDFRAVRIDSIPVQPLARDTFERETDLGWGVAEAGGPWVTDTPEHFFVRDASGRVKFDRGRKRSIRLSNVRELGANIAVTLHADKLSRRGEQISSVVVRRVSEGNEYRVRLRRKIDGTVTLAITRLIDGDERVLTSEIRVAGASTIRPVRVIAQVRGQYPTTIKASAYDAAGGRSIGWMLETTDRVAALQDVGTIGWAGSIDSIIDNAPVTFIIDDLLAAIPPPQPS